MACRRVARLRALRAAVNMQTWWRGVLTRRKFIKRLAL
ncbi:MAG: hypothetical protein GY917_19480, partial [Planctomycetaceae bacterium]|nr:hypothetical protein [Planctomycetaceae bacterium]